MLYSRATGATLAQKDVRDKVGASLVNMNFYSPKALPHIVILVFGYY